MTTHRTLPLVALVSLATLLTARAAHADPSAEAQSQLRMGFEYCDKGNPQKYFFQRDFAFKVDPSIKGWTGAIKSYAVPQTLARCDASMKKQTADDAHQEEVSKAWEAVKAACFRLDRAAFTPAKATFVAKNGNSAALALEGGKDAKDVIAKCEADLAADQARRDKNEADEAKRQAEYQAQRKAADEKQAKEDAAEKALFDRLKGDRIAVARDKGLPTSPESARMPTAAAWTYSMYQGGSGEFQGYLCTTVVTFKGNKKTSEKRRGPGCNL